MQEKVDSPWTAEETALLGKDSDVAIAARLGITPASVRHRRVLLGIPARWRGRPPKRMVEGAVVGRGSGKPES